VKYYKLMTDTILINKGGIFTFEAKHKIMSEMSFEEQRCALWVEVTKETADAEGVFTLKDLDPTGTNLSH
jgi:hypothetical protein